MSFEQDEAALKERIEQIKQRYKSRLDDLSAKGKKLQNEYERPSDVGAVVGIDFKVDWEDVELIFDVPNITIENRSISFDLPEVAVSDQKIIFDVPDVRIVDRKVGQYPEFHGFKIVWKDIIISVPELYMRRVEIVMGLPFVTMNRKEIVLGLPKLTMERVRWVVGLPQFTVVNVSVETDRIKQAGQELQSEARALAKLMEQEIDAEVQLFKAKLSAHAIGAKTDVANKFNQALGMIKSAIEDLQRNGCDPIKVPTSRGNVNLRKMYEEVDATKARALNEFDQVAGVVS